MDCKIKMTLKITPFGSINYEMSTPNKPRKEDLIEMPKYVEPLTTNIQNFDINYEEENTYIIPKTTA